MPSSDRPAASADTASPPENGSAAPLIRAENVSKRYPMGQTPVDALKGLSVNIAQGRFVGIVGRSGSGKSTLLHLLAAMDRPTEGRITVGTWELDALSRKEQAQYRREMVGIIFQQFNLVPTMTARENVALPMVLSGAPRAARRARAAECLAMVDLADRMDHRPAELSGGEQQRVAAARALVHDPPLLLADEPTGNLDSETGAQIIGLLSRVHREQGRTIVVVTHHFDEIAGVTEQVIELHDGRLSGDEGSGMG